MRLWDLPDDIIEVIIKFLNYRSKLLFRKFYPFKITFPFLVSNNYIKSDANFISELVEEVELLENYNYQINFSLYKLLQHPRITKLELNYHQYTFSKLSSDKIFLCLTNEEINLMYYSNKIHLNLLKDDIIPEKNLNLITSFRGRKMYNFPNLEEFTLLNCDIQNKEFKNFKRITFINCIVNSSFYNISELTLMNCLIKEGNKILKDINMLTIDNCITLGYICLENILYAKIFETENVLGDVEMLVEHNYKSSRRCVNAQFLIGNNLSYYDTRDVLLDTSNYHPVLDFSERVKNVLIINPGIVNIYFKEKKNLILIVLYYVNIIIPEILINLVNFNKDSEVYVINPHGVEYRIIGIESHIEIPKTNFFFDYKMYFLPEFNLDLEKIIRSYIH